MPAKPMRLHEAGHLSRGRRTASWLIDEAITVALVASGIGMLVAIGESLPSVSSGAMALTALIVALLIPVLYGLFCFTGRSIGCLVAGTAFFSVATGSRAHNARMMWVMGHRWLWPLLAIMFVVSLFDADVTPSADRLHAQRRVRGLVPVRSWEPPVQQPQQYQQRVQPYPPQQQPPAQRYSPQQPQTQQNSPSAPQHQPTQNGGTGYRPL